MNRERESIGHSSCAVASARLMMYAMIRIVEASTIIMISMYKEEYAGHLLESINLYSTIYELQYN